MVAFCQSVLLKRDADDDDDDDDLWAFHRRGCGEVAQCPSLHIKFTNTFRATIANQTSSYMLHICLLSQCTLLNCTNRDG